MKASECEAGIEVSGESLGAIVEGFKKYPSIASRYLAKYGLMSLDASGQMVVDRSKWYPLKEWLIAHEGIAQEIGHNSLYGIGKSVPENAVFPPHIKDIYSAIESIDVAYHLNHRRNGVLMFDPQTGMMLEGIGHYRVTRVPNEQQVSCVCDNPYPCEFDRGIISAMANRFERQARTVHDNEAPCRRKGADSCTYVVWW
jgi:hypothetical protein